MLIYIHVPFCTKKCHYCAFHSRPLQRESADGALYIRGYLDALLMEIAQWADRLGPQSIETVFFGGGTPSLLPPKVIGTVLDRINKSFTLTPDAEISMESNPESLSTKQIAYEFLATGINRVSLGVQSLDDALLRILGRSHSSTDAIRAYNALRTAQCSNINLDLMWGLPTQKIQQWRATLKEVIFLGPDHISMYGLTLEENTPMADAVAAKLLTLPDEQSQSYMYLQGAEILEDSSIVQYEVSNFARMGMQCRHNLGYWEGKEYLGLGPAASSTIRDKRWTNPVELGDWGRMVTSKSLPSDVEELTPHTRLLECMMLRLRTVRGMRLKAYADLTGRSFIQDHKRLIQALHEHGLIRISQGYMRLTRQGLLVSNSILSSLFEAVENVFENKPSQFLVRKPPLDQIPPL